MTRQPKAGEVFMSLAGSPIVADPDRSTMVLKVNPKIKKVTLCFAIFTILYSASNLIPNVVLILVVISSRVIFYSITFTYTFWSDFFCYLFISFLLIDNCGGG